MALFALLVLSFVAACYGQLGNHGNQYTPYYVQLPGGGYATYLRPNQQVYRPLGSSAPDANKLTSYPSVNPTNPYLSSGYLPYSYVLNLQSDRVVGGSNVGSISKPVADSTEQRIQPQLVTPRYNIQPPAYSSNGNVQPLGPTPNTYILIPVSDNVGLYGNRYNPYYYSGYPASVFQPGVGGFSGFGGGYGAEYRDGTLVAPHKVEAEAVKVTMEQRENVERKEATETKKAEA